MPADHTKPSAESPSVGLFVTCLVDLIRPNIGFAAVALLEQAGCRVDVPAKQTCCGQPAYNSGDRRNARQVAMTVIDAFADHDYVVAPSGSCAGMIRLHYADLFRDDPDMLAKVTAIAGKTHELISFLTDILGIELNSATYSGKVTYHDSCSGLRELNVRDQPRAYLAQVAGLELVELPDADVCCGFGGTFCVKYPEISNAMVDAKVDAIVATGAGTVLAGDLGCLLNIAGKLHRRGVPIAARHVAEVLADLADGPAIGQAER